jgi:hypothetical protein
MPITQPVLASLGEDTIIEYIVVHVCCSPMRKYFGSLTWFNRSSSVFFLDIDTHSRFYLT